MSGRPATDLTGRVFERLTVVERAGSDHHRKAWWRCRCTCGVLWRVRGSDLLGGKTRSCGCRRVEGSRQRMVVRHAAAALTRAA